MDYSAIPANDLAALCFASGDEAAWNEFVRRFRHLIASVVIRMAEQWGHVSNHMVDDLIQETYLKLYQERKRFAESFKPIHPDAIFGYLKVVTANLMHDRLKASHSLKRGEQVTEALEDSSVPRLSSRNDNSESLDLDRGVLLAEIDACLQDVASGHEGERDRQIFWLYYRVGLSSRAIAALPTTRLTTKGVESTVFRLSHAIRERLVRRHNARKSSEAADKGKMSAESL